MPTEDKRLSRGRNTLQTLWHSLAELTNDRPLSEITIDDICSHCNLTKGAFYHHFSSRDDLLGQFAVTDMSLYMADAIQQAALDFPDSPPVQMLEWIYAVSRYVERRKTAFKGYIFIGHPGNRLTEYVAAWYTAAQACFVRWQQEGVLRTDMSAQELHHYFDSFTYGIAALCMNDYYPLAPAQPLLEGFITSLLSPAYAASFSFPEI